MTSIKLVHDEVKNVAVLQALHAHTWLTEKANDAVALLTKAASVIRNAETQILLRCLSSDQYGGKAFQHMNAQLA